MAGLKGQCGFGFTEVQALFENPRAFMRCTPLGIEGDETEVKASEEDFQDLLVSLLPKRTSQKERKLRRKRDRERRENCLRRLVLKNAQARADRATWARKNRLIV